MEGMEEYKVEKVLDSRRYGRGRKLQYLVAWKGYPDSDNQWVNWDNAEGAQEAIGEFKRLNPNCETHIKASIDLPYSLSSTHICSMSTSPSLTANWNFDTPENRATWDATTSPSSYFAPAVTYGDNNNIDDAATYNDCRRRRRSPGIASDILNTTTILRDVEKSETHLPSRTPSHHDHESTGRPPILEDGSRSVGRRLPLQSLHTTGEEAGTAGKSAGSTPYPNATILFESSNDKDDDIKCGRCKNPIAYCHCSPTMLPPRINVDEEEDDKEATVSLTETANKENRLVEVCVGWNGELRRMYTPVPYPHSRRLCEGKITSPSISPPLMGKVSPQPNGSRFVWE
jgi:hypothetical protein